MPRPSFEEIYIQMALTLSRRSTCLRLQVGTVIASHDYRKVLSVGYNGNASGLPNECDVRGPAGVGGCGCLHAEENAAISCDVPRATRKIVLCTHLPCPQCAKRLINLGGVERVIYLEEYRRPESRAILTGASIDVVKHAVAPDATDAPPNPALHPTRLRWRSGERVNATVSLLGVLKVVFSPIHWLAVSLTI